MIEGKLPAKQDSTSGVNRPSVLWKLAQVFCRIVCTCLFDLKVYGRRNVPLDGPVLLVCNHQSNLDPMLIGVRLDRTLSYIAKSELFRSRWSNGVLRWFGAFPVRQGSVDIYALREAIARLRQGRALAIFPEGSRTEDGNLLPIQRGVGLIVRRTGAPVLPVVLDGSFHAWSIHMNMFRAGRIRLLYGTPHDLSELDEGQIVEWIQRTLGQMFAQLKQMEAREGRARSGEFI